MAANVPIRTPFFDGRMTDEGMALVSQLGSLNRPWVLFLQSLAESPSSDPGGGGGGTGAVGLVREYTLTANFPLVSPATPQNGQGLTVFITQDSTGGWQITWSADFVLAQVDIDTTPDTVSVFSFVGRGGKWWMSTAPLTGQTP